MAAFSIDGTPYPALAGSDEVEWQEVTRFRRAFDGTALTSLTSDYARLRRWPRIRIGWLDDTIADALFETLADAEEVELDGDMVEGGPVAVLPMEVDMQAGPIVGMWEVSFEAQEIG